MIYGDKATILKDIGERMRLRRLSLNLTQAVAAERSGISAMTLKNLESGRGASLWALVSLCRTYGHDAWVLALAPDENLHFQVKQSQHERKRASRTKGASHV